MAERPGPPARPVMSLMASRYAIYGGPYQRGVRVVVLALLTAEIASTDPSPGLHGHGLVILVTLVLTLAAQAAALSVPSRAVVPRIFVEVLAGGILTGFDAGSAAVLLAFGTADGAVSLSLGQSVYATALGVVAEALATLAASNHSGDALLGLAAVAGFLVGTTLRQYELRAEQAELRLADVKRAEIERARAVQLAERTNAAREIHDILAHSLGALVMQLNALNAVLDGPHPDVDSLRPLVHDAHRHAVDGLVEARQAVASLRDDTAPIETSLHTLVDNNPAATLDVTGTPRPVPADIAVVMRRITQEALTNAAKHAPGSTSLVQLDFLPSAITLTVTDSGISPDAPDSILVGTGGGYGLAGMRERAELIGARLAAGPRGNGWQVHLTIPDRITTHE